MRTMSQMVGASYRCRGISGANERTAGLQAWRPHRHQAALGYLPLACALYVFRRGRLR
jgi:hypothetical protein